MKSEVLNLRLSNLELSLPQIVSNSSIEHRIKGSNGLIYNVNITNYTCTCKNWQEDRKNFSTSDIRRACKHISSLMNLIPYSWIMPLPTCSYQAAITEIDNYTYAFIRKESNDWIDVFVLNPKNEIYDYGFSVSEKRWSNKLSPRHSKFIKPLILS